MLRKSAARMLARPRAARESCRRACLACGPARKLMRTGVNPATSARSRRKGPKLS
jgi:hypothetical protein